MGLRWRHRPSTGTGRTLTPAARVGESGPGLYPLRAWVYVKPRSALPPCGVSVRFRASSMSTSKAEEYRTKAREAEQLAERTDDSAIKEQALKIAEQWRYMADYEEKRGRR